MEKIVLDYEKTPGRGATASQGQVAVYEKQGGCYRLVKVYLRGYNNTNGNYEAALDRHLAPTKVIAVNGIELRDKAQACYAKNVQTEGQIFAKVEKIYGYNQFTAPTRELGWEIEKQIKAQVDASILREC